MHIDVVYISPGVEFIESVEMQQGTNVQQAIIKSGLLTTCSNISLDKCQVGIFGNIVSLETALTDGDRVEVYRSLAMNPMEARRLRAAKLND